MAWAPLALKVWALLWLCGSCLRDWARTKEGEAVVSSAVGGGTAGRWAASNPDNRH